MCNFEYFYAHAKVTSDLNNEMDLLNSSKFQIGAAVIIPNIGGLINGKITSQNLKPWYASLNKPSFNPPNWVFAPVWTSLYTGIGYASYLYRDGGGFHGKAQTALTLYGIQLILNHAWTPLFFKYHSMKWSAIEIALLTGTAGACGVSFYKINSLAGQLFIPYLAWLAFASVLNYSYYKLNPDRQVEGSDYD